MSINLRGKRVTVVGLGVHGGGIATVKFLLRHGAQVLVSDRQDAKALHEPKKIIQNYWKELHRNTPELSPIQWSLGFKEHPADHISQADCIVVNPDVSRNSLVFTLAKKHRIPVRVGDTSLFMEYYPGPIIGVTGTRGKTTTTTLLGDILRAYDARSFIGGNLRISPLDRIDKFLNQSKRTLPWVALELSSWQVEGLGDIKKSPRIAVVTNLMPDHLNRYSSMAAYARAKARILKYQHTTDIAILNADDERVKAFSSIAHGEVWWTSREALPAGFTGVFLDEGWIWLQTPKRRSKILPVNAIKVRGEHMIPNVLSAIASAAAAGVPSSIITTVVKRFRGVPGRLELVRTVNGIRYYNDTTATIPEAAIAALHAVNSISQQRCILIAGGADKKLNYVQFAKEVKNRVKILILFDGDASAKIRHALTALEKKGQQIPMIVTGVDSMIFAVKLAAAVAQKGDTVLLSPAAASFGVFRHAYDRGDQFVSAVKKL